MNDRKDEAYENKLMDTAFTSYLYRPSATQLMNSILKEKECSVTQSENNTLFMRRVMDDISEYVDNIELNFSEGNDFDGTFECKCDYDCECSLNNFSMHAFKEVYRKFDVDIYNDLFLNKLFEGYTEQEVSRIAPNAYEILKITLFKRLSVLAYEIGLYGVSCMMHEMAIFIYAGTLRHLGINDIESELSARGKKASDARWEPHREKRKERKEKYLKIMKDKGFSTYTDTATYIKMHVDTGSSPSFPTICRLLSEADKGDFS
uniref:hypothetical protein n=1 Tax=uncultured Psychrobacter sp. TaxID=259303 RepID=UPI00262267C8|nr:hypothetical protein [uncultured Psychrobacter sp.]